MKNYLVKDDSKIIPKVKAADIGTKVTLYCDSLDIVKWFFERQDTLPTSLPIHLKSSLTLQIKVESSGFYFCYSCSRKYRYSFLAKAELIVYGELPYDTFKLDTSLYPEF